MAHIVEHLPVAELERRYRAAEDVTEARHLQAVWLLAQGRTMLDVAGVLAFTPCSGTSTGAAQAAAPELVPGVEQLAARYNAHGPDATALTLRP